MPIQTQIDAALELNGKIYAIRRDSLYCYDPNTDEWTTQFTNGNFIYSNDCSMYKSEYCLYISEANGKTHQYDLFSGMWTMVSLIKSKS